MNYFSGWKEIYAYIRIKTRLSDSTIRRMHRADPIRLMKSTPNKQGHVRINRQTVDRWIDKFFDPELA